jgi:CRP-like cAMP-binding protein
MAGDITGQLTAFAAFADMDAAHVASIAASLEPFRAGPGELLFRQNDVADGMHVVAKGRIGVQGRTLADGEMTLAEIGAGDVVGEFALIDQGRRSATARAIEPVSGWFLPREQFERLTFVGDPAAMRLWRHIRLLAASRARATILAIAEAPAAPGEVRPAAGKGRAVRSARTTEEMAALVGALHQFRAFRAEEVAELLAGSKVLEAPRGTVLAAAGDAADGLRIVVRGAVRLGLVRPGGVEQLLVHGPGKIAGAGPAVDSQPHAAQLEVREDALIVQASQAQVAAWRAEPGGMAAKLVDLTAKQLTADLRALSRHQGRRRSMAALNASLDTGA